MAFRIGRGCGRRGRPVANGEVLEAMQQMQARLEAMEMGGDASGRGSFFRGRGGRGRGREVRCYKCNKLGHKAYECLENIRMNQRNEIVAKIEEEATKVI